MESEWDKEMGTRQQTVSEWETGLYRPRGASKKMLSILAERSSFQYGTEVGDEGPGTESEPPLDKGSGG